MINWLYLQQIKLLGDMQVAQMFSVIGKTQGYGIEGYHVDNKYFDARRSREQKILQQSKTKSGYIHANPATKKTTYIDDVLKRSSTIVGPTTYNPKQIPPLQKIQLKGQSPPRKTIFDEMQTIEKKRNYPAAGKYDKIEVQINKSKLKSNLSKAEVNTYLDNSMRGSIQCPGVGSYNTKVQVFDRRGPKWMAQKRKKSQSERTMNLPPVGTYNPLPIDYSLFQNLSVAQKKKSKSYFNKQQRFKTNKTKAIPYYDVLSQWGMKDKLKKKDILSRVGSSLKNHSIYY